MIEKIELTKLGLEESKLLANKINELIDAYKILEEKSK